LFGFLLALYHGISLSASSFRSALIFPTVQPLKRVPRDFLKSTTTITRNSLLPCHP
jgi:hypothetical protein